MTCEDTHLDRNIVAVEPPWNARWWCMVQRSSDIAAWRRNVTDRIKLYQRRLQAGHANGQLGLDIASERERDGKVFVVASS